MGVMECSRAECPNVMCDRYSPEYGYICNSCFDELGKNSNDCIATFMSTPKTEAETETYWSDYLKLTFTDSRGEDV